MRAAGKSTIVTGAGNGIGEGIARRLAAEGACVVVNDIDAAGAKAPPASVPARTGAVRTGRHDAPCRGQALTARTLELFGRLDVVNNAGWTHRNRPMLEVSEEEFDRVCRQHEKHLPSAIHGVPAMRANPQGSSGCFINIASTAGIRPRPGLTWYNGSKGAVITTSKSMAAELGPDGIRVNCINPVFNPDTGLAAEFAGGPVDEPGAPGFWPPFRWAAFPPRWMWPMPRCTWPATRRRSSAASASRWMAPGVSDARR
jgi:3-oxoacyl-[acyl-carrier protein] reductase